MHVQRIRQVLDGLPEGPGQWGSYANLAVEGGAAEASEVQTIQHGLALRLRLPFPQASALQVWMNGERLTTSATSGYSSWIARGFRHVQINIPPEITRREELFVVTCQFLPGR
jgi:hypothetical protein